MSKTRFKRGKFGQTPGDYPIGVKIFMLENDQSFEVLPYKTISKNCIKGFRKDHKKKIESRFRTEGRNQQNLEQE